MRGQAWCHHCGAEILEFFELFDHVSCTKPPDPVEVDATVEEARRTRWQTEKRVNRAVKTLTKMYKRGWIPGPQPRR
jgi:hypothetical protein